MLYVALLEDLLKSSDNIERNCSSYLLIFNLHKYYLNFKKELAKYD